MKPESKYHKIISLTLLLFFIITIQHYSSSLIGNLLSLDPAKDDVPELVIPAIYIDAIPFLKDRADCTQQLSSTTCSNKPQLKKNS